MKGLVSGGKGTLIIHSLPGRNVVIRKGDGRARAYRFMPGDYPGITFP